MKFEREEQRYEYPLNANSVVLDVGAFRGQWTKEIHRRYGCTVHAFEPVFFREVRETFAGINGNVNLYCVALANSDREIDFGIQHDMTGRFSWSHERVMVPTIGVVHAWKKLGLRNVDLVKLNVEGMEVELIDAFCDSRLIDNIENLQVQFHHVIANADNEIARLVGKLSETHEMDWGGEWFLWSSFKRRRRFMSFSQAGQDCFVYEVTGKSNGTFLDIGCNHPWNISNTYGLEQIGWTGKLFDAEIAHAELIKIHRSSPFYHGDAVAQNWAEHCNGYIDYLSLDIDAGTADCLQKLPLNNVRFGVITIEHDAYCGGEKRREIERDVLSRAGYVLIAGNVKHNGYEYEDWWVSKELESKAEKFKSNSVEWTELFK